MYKVILIILAIALGLFGVYFASNSSSKDAFCENERYKVDTTHQQWTPMLEDICGSFKN